MMRHLEYYCDRCHQQVTERGLSTVQMTLVIPGDTPRPVHTELCQRCGLQLEKWLSTMPEEPNANSGREMA